MRKAKSPAERALAEYVGERVWSIRLEKEWPASTAARRSGLMVLEWRSLESGKVKVTEAMVEVLAEALEVTPSALLPPGVAGTATER